MNRQRAYLAGLMPALLLIGLFYIWPALWAIWVSLTDLNLSTLGGTTAFVGVDNYRRFFSDPDFPLVLRNTGVFVFASAVLGQFGLGLGLALLFDHAEARGFGLARPAYAAVLLAWISPLVLVGFIWLGMLEFYDGALNAMLVGLGREPIDWLGRFPMTAIIVADIWRGTAFAMVILLAAVRSVPRSISEAAQLDGAGTWRRFIDQTWPLVQGVASLTLVLTIISTLGGFLLIDALTRGANFQTTTLALYAYDRAFAQFEIGYGAAIGVLILGLNLVCALIIARIAGGRR